MKLLIQITKGLIRDLNARRTAMFVLLIVALVMLFVGSTFLSASLMERPIMMLTFWAVCLWLTFCALLLAIYDMIVLRVAARRERHRLKEEIFGRDRNVPD